VGNGHEVNLFQVGASIMHKPSGLGIYGMYQHEDAGGTVTDTGGSVAGITFDIPDTDAWYIKPFSRKTWSPIGATVLFGEYGQYKDQFGGIAGVSVHDFLDDPAALPACEPTGECYITGSEVQRWGVGLVQEIDSAAMHLWVRWHSGTRCQLFYRLAVPPQSLQRPCSPSFAVSVAIPPLGLRSHFPSPLMGERRQSGTLKILTLSAS
jgi:hypothetical protein